MKRVLFRLAALALCIGLLPGAQRQIAQYLILAQSDAPGGRTRLTTYTFDENLRERGTSTDVWAVARRSPKRLRFRTDGHRWYTVDGAALPIACRNGPGYYALSPSGSAYVCVNGYLPDTEFRVYRTRDRRLIASLKPAGAVPEAHDAFTFLDNDHLAFRTVDRTCPDEHASIDVVAIQPPFARKRLIRCASAVIAGTRHVAYLRGAGDAEYSLDGGRAWVAHRLYALDRDDSPITAESPLMRSVATLHPNAEVLWISVSVSE